MSEQSSATSNREELKNKLRRLESEQRKLLDKKIEARAKEDKLKSKLREAENTRREIEGEEERVGDRIDEIRSILNANQEESPPIL